MSLNPAPTRRSKGLSRPVIYALSALGLLVAAWGGWQLVRPKAEKDPYRTQAVTQGDITRSVSASGSLQALVQVDVGSQISGQILKVFVDFNDQVSAGQVLATLDPQTYLSRLRQGQAQIAANQAQVAQAQAQAEEARAAYNRTRILFDQGIMAKAALDSAQAAWKSAQANVQASRAGVTQSQAALASTQTDLGRGQKSGLIESQKILGEVRGIAMTHFLSEDVVRHPLVQKIINAYEAYEKIQAEQAEKGH